jgi:hypothetical protein
MPWIDDHPPASYLYGSKGQPDAGDDATEQGPHKESADHQ